MKKRIISLVLAVAMTISLFVGCGSDGKSEAESDNVTADAENTEDVEDVEESDSAAIDTSEEVELKVLMLSQKSTDWEDVWAKINELLKEKINATVKVDYLSWAEYGEKYPLILTSGESYDLVYTSAWCYYKEMVQKEVFTELTDEMIATYMPETAARVTENQWASTLVDGKRYMVPFTQPEDKNRFVAMIRGDLREKYNIPEVTDWAGFVNYLETIAAQDGEITAYNCGAGDGATMIMQGMLFGSLNYWGLGLATDQWDICLDIEATEAAKEAVFVDALENEEMMSVYEELTKLRQAGVWSQNVLSNDTMLDQAFENGLSAAYVRITPNVMPQWSKYNIAHPEWKLEVVDLQIEGAEQYLSSSNGNGYAVPLTAANPERALMALDLIRYDQELQDLVSLGIEDVHWIAEGDDKYSVTEKSVDYPYGDGSMSYGFHTDITRTLSGYPDNMQAILDDISERGETPLLLNFNFNTEPVKSEYAAIAAICGEYTPILKNGLSDNPAATMQEMRDKMNAAGLQTVLDEYSAQLKEFYASFE